MKRKGPSEVISLIITVALVVAFLGSGAILSAQVLEGRASDANLSRIFESLLLIFATAWKTEHGQGMTVNASPTDTLNVNSGDGTGTQSANEEGAQ